MIEDTNKILSNTLNKFIEIIKYKLNLISIIERKESYRIKNDMLIKDKSCMLIKKLRYYGNNNEYIYNYIRIYIDHCINITQIILFDINHELKKNIYNKHYNSNVQLKKVYSFNYNIKILYMLTYALANTLLGLNNLDMYEDYYNLLIWDIKKIIITYITNNLKTFNIFEYIKR